MFVTNWISTTKIQKISEITKFFRHYFLSRTEVIIKEQTVIEIMIMNIMQLNNIRLYFLDLLNQSTRSLLRTQSFIIKNSLLSIMSIHIPLGTYLYTL